MINATVHMVVKNEDRFIWYAISSVLSRVKKLIITDTGSTDKTVSIIRSFKDRKIQFRQTTSVSPKDVTLARQNQLDATETDWIWLVDGDEIYPDKTISEISDLINRKGNELEGIIVGRYDLLGDIYHFQDDSAGFYDLFGRKGHFALRLINKKAVPSLHLEGIYPYEGYYDSQGVEITNHDKKNYHFTSGSLFHAMYLRRSSAETALLNTFNRGKYKIETGIKIPVSGVPPVLFVENPVSHEYVRGNRSFSYEVAARLLTPFKTFKRNLF